MNNEQQQINKAVKKGINKLVAFAVEFKPENGNWFSIDVRSGCISCMVWDRESKLYDISFVSFPQSTETIDNFNCKVETLIAEIKRDYK